MTYESRRESHLDTRLSQIGVGAPNRIKFGDQIEIGLGTKSHLTSGKSNLHSGQGMNRISARVTEKIHIRVWDCITFGPRAVS